MNMPRTNWPAGLAAAALFLGLQSMVQPSDTEALTDVASEVEALAVESLQIEAEVELMARQLCTDLHGDRAQVLRLVEGHLVCRRRGEML
jgi:hypothetical protein